MNQSQKFLITGGTGNQGGAVINCLLKDGKQVRALCRNPQSPKAKALLSQGVEVVQGDLNHPDSYVEHLEEVQGVFSVQAFNKNISQEITQGIQLADAVKAAGIPHLLYSSVSGADQNTGIPHFDSKYQIEKHIIKLGLPSTIIRPVSFCENMLMPRVKNSILKGKFVMPLDKDTVQQYITMHDIGIIGSKILQDPQPFMSKTLTIATDQMSMLELTQLFEEILARKVKYQKLPGLITRLAMGKDLTKMFKWMDNNEFIFANDIQALKTTFPGLIDMRTWIKNNF